MADFMKVLKTLGKPQMTAAEKILLESKGLLTEGELFEFTHLLWETKSRRLREWQNLEVRLGWATDHDRNIELRTQNHRRWEGRFEESTRSADPLVLQSFPLTEEGKLEAIQAFHKEVQTRLGA